MYILFKKLILAITVTIFVSCETGDKFTGSPVGTSVEFVTLKGVVSSTETSVGPNQRFPVTFTLPQAFDVDVLVEIIAFLPSTNKRTRKSFMVAKGQTVTTVLVTSPGSDSPTILPFNLNLEVYLSSISSIASENYPSGFVGKQYSLTSNTINFDYGDTRFAAVNSNRCGIVFDWKDANGSNNNDLDLVLKKNSVIVPVLVIPPTSPINGTTTSSGRYEQINFLSTAPDGEYIIGYYAKKLVTIPSELPYRITVLFPNELQKTYSGVLSNLTLGTASSSIPKLKIIKSTVNSIAQYDVTLL